MMLADLRRRREVSFDLDELDLEYERRLWPGKAHGAQLVGTVWRRCGSGAVAARRGAARRGAARRGCRRSEHRAGVRDRRERAFLAVRNLRGDGELGLAALLHKLQTLRPPRDDAVEPGSWNTAESAMSAGPRGRIAKSLPSAPERPGGSSRVRGAVKSLERQP